MRMVSQRLYWCPGKYQSRHGGFIGKKVWNDSWWMFGKSDAKPGELLNRDRGDVRQRWWPPWFGRWTPWPREGKAKATLGGHQLKLIKNAKICIYSQVFQDIDWLPVQWERGEETTTWLKMSEKDLILKWFPLQVKPIGSTKNPN